MTEMIKIKMALATSMNEYVMKTDDEELFDMWLEIYPDESTNEDVQFICEDCELWQTLCITFGEITKINENRG